MNAYRKYVIAARRRLSVLPNVAIRIVIGTSESYNSEAGRENGIASVKANAPTAAVEDETA